MAGATREGNSSRQHQERCGAQGSGVRVRHHRHFVINCCDWRRGRSVDMACGSRTVRRSANEPITMDARPKNAIAVSRWVKSIDAPLSVSTSIKSESFCAHVLHACCHEDRSVAEGFSSGAASFSRIFKEPVAGSSKLRRSARRRLLSCVGMRQSQRRCRASVCGDKSWSFSSMNFFPWLGVQLRKTLLSDEMKRKVRLATSWILEAILLKGPRRFGFRSTHRGGQSPADSREIAGHAVPQ
jgi:hypothetical protein